MDNTCYLIKKWISNGYQIRIIKISNKISILNTEWQYHLGNDIDNKLNRKEL